ncbi:MAG TPA: YerC/YecD family TrpR-related protein [Bacillota bacterium]
MASDPRLRHPSVDRLFEAILSLRDVDECYRFFEDLCTVREVRAMAQRLEVARMLAEGHTYDAIVAATGMSTATISRIRRFLDYGADGYRLVLERMGVGAHRPRRTR